MCPKRLVDKHSQNLSVHPYLPLACLYGHCQCLLVCKQYQKLKEKHMGKKLKVEKILCIN